MRKRFVTTLLTSILAVACAFGFAACTDGNDGNNDNIDDNEQTVIEMPKGQEVTEEQWKAAIEATLNSNDFTLEVSGISSETGKKKNEEDKLIDYSNIVTSSRIVYWTDDEAYIQDNGNMKTSGYKELYDEDDYEEELSNVSYLIVEGATLWVSRLENSKYIEGAPEDYEEGEEGYGYYNSYAYNKEYTDAETAKIGIASYNDEIKWEEFDYYSTSAESTDEKNLSVLYDSFTYNNGIYSATLYYYGSEATVEVAIKDGYVIGLKLYSVEEQTEDGESIKREMSYIYVFKNYGSTTVTAPAWATEAIEKAKAE